MTNTNKICCKLCGAEVHAIPHHLKDTHPELSLADYQARFPEAPILSELAKKKLMEKRLERANKPEAVSGETVRLALFEAFSLPEAAHGVRNARGEPIQISVLGNDAEFANMIPEVDPGYVYDIETLKNALMGVAMGLSGGKANPVVLQKLMDAALDA